MLAVQEEKGQPSLLLVGVIFAAERLCGGRLRACVDDAGFAQIVARCFLSPILPSKELRCFQGDNKDRALRQMLMQRSCHFDRREKSLLLLGRNDPEKLQVEQGSPCFLQRASPSPQHVR